MFTKKAIGPLRHIHNAAWGLYDTVSFVWWLGANEMTCDTYTRASTICSNAV